MTITHYVEVVLFESWLLRRLRFDLCDSYVIFPCYIISSLYGWHTMSRHHTNTSVVRVTLQQPYIPMQRCGAHTSWRGTQGTDRAQNFSLTNSFTRIPPPLTPKSSSQCMSTQHNMRVTQQCNELQHTYTVTKIKNEKMAKLTECATYRTICFYYIHHIRAYVCKDIIWSGMLRWWEYAIYLNNIFCEFFECSIHKGVRGCVSY